MGVYGHAYVFYGIIENDEDHYNGLLTQVHNRITDDSDEWDEKLYNKVNELQEKYQVELARYADDLTILSATMQGTSAKGWSYDEVDASVFQDTATSIHKHTIQSFLQELTPYLPLELQEVRLDTPNWYILSYMG